MSILSGIRKQKRYIADENGDKTLVSEWTNTDTVELSDEIENREHPMSETDVWDDTYDEDNSQPTDMNDFISKITATFNNTKYLNKATDTNVLQNKLMSFMINISHPVGSLYWSKNNTNPNSLFPGTNWERITHKFIYAAGDNDIPGTGGGTESNTVRINGNVGDTKLTQQQIPSHAHSIPKLSGTAKSAGGHTHGYNYPNWYGTGSGSSQSDNGSGWTGYYGDYRTTSDGAHTHSVETNTSNTGNTGGSQGHSHSIDISKIVNNLPPYEYYYCWIRTE